ncbi:Clp protease N-terminal domain-containing protein [Streptomyces sp. GMY02]|uniref:Clp protease N-terminal domain-containing protein n=1 Tax=Streptomyces sp. GMY02 TaxID=1333528 RepID=UPI001C2C2364|nr:Clp protease N-terminal domain-containing protein [Streptomyces sp. GMY02]QXE34642.1 Clp protease N-terminal domain-containing protein [Streptomyces sp. GMY02]
MENRPPLTARTDATGNHAAQLDSEATEFESDVIDLLAEMLLRAHKRELPNVGTEDLLAALVLGDSAAGEAIAPGMRRAGSLSGMIAGKAGRGWVSADNSDGNTDDDNAGDGSVGNGGGTSAVPADEHEVDAAWRVAQWHTARRFRGEDAPGDRPWPEPSGALRACLLHAFRLARAEGCPGVYSRHVARALLDLPGTRAREACVLRRLDLSAAYAALDTLDDRAGAGAEGPGSDGPGAERPGTARLQSPAVTVLRRAGVLEDRSNWLARKVMSWTSGSLDDGTPILFAVSVEAKRQAVRSGRSTAEPVDLLLAVLGLDRALSVARRSLPEALVSANEAATLLRTHGVRPVSLSRSARPADPLAVFGDVPFSAAADRALAVARLTAAEHGAPSVGTVHLVAALLDEAEGPVSEQLRAQGVDLTALKADLSLRLSA